jgi:hypothetical protein
MVGGELVEIIKSMLRGSKEMVRLRLWKGRDFKANLEREDWTTDLYDKSQSAEVFLMRVDVPQLPFHPPNRPCLGWEAGPDRSMSSSTISGILGI